MIYCPYCKNRLTHQKSGESSSIQREFYECEICHKSFERNIIKNIIGLFKSDELYEINEAGEYLQNF